MLTADIDRSISGGYNEYNVEIGKFGFLTKIAIALIVALAVFFALVYTDWHRASTRIVIKFPEYQQQTIKPRESWQLPPEEFQPAPGSGESKSTREYLEELQGK